ncbi:hypothetical protein COOONC_21096 [Cooperia oncophora]
MMIKLLLLMVLFDSSLCLTEKGRAALTRAFKGIDLEKRHERLRMLGMKGLGLSTGAGKSTASTNGKTISATATNAAAGGLKSAIGGVAPIQEVNHAEGIDEYLYDGDMILTEYTIIRAVDARIPPSTKQKISVTAPSKCDKQQTAAHKSFIRTTLKYLQARTCITFIESATAKSRIRVFDGSGLTISFVRICRQRTRFITGSWFA